MLRLAHRILSQSVLYEFVANDQFEPHTFQPKADDHWDVPVIIADNIYMYVSNYMRDNSEKKQLDELPACVPPFTAQFIEWNIPEVSHTRDEAGELQVITREHVKMLQAGVYVYSSRSPDGRPILKGKDEVLDHALDKHDRNIGWVVSGLLYLTTPKGSPLAAGAGFTVILDLNGKLISTMGSCWHEELRELINVGVCMTLMSSSFTHCRNVSTVDVSETQGPGRKWCRRQKVPELKYHVLSIDPNLAKFARKDAVPDGLDRSGKAEHVCRGHFRTYSEDGGGMFGRGIVGTFFIESHKRGSAVHGTVLKDYSVMAPAA